MSEEMQFLGIILVFCSLSIAVIALAPSYLQVITDQKAPKAILGLLNYIFFACFSLICIVAFHILRDQSYKYILLVSAPMVCIAAVFIVIFVYYRSQVVQWEK